MADIADRVVLIDSLSKRYSVCGARVGCVVTKNEALGRAFLQLGQARLCPPALEQAGAVALEALGPDYFAGVQREYRRRRDATIAGLRDIPGVSASTPEGAFYTMARLPVRDAERFAIFMLTDFRLDGETVMVAPGEGFYVTPGLGRDEIRIAYVLEVERLERAMKCLKAGLAAFVARGG
jgi:aspartate aminotransferase